MSIKIIVAGILVSVGAVQGAWAVKSELSKPAPIVTAKVGGCNFKYQDFYSKDSIPSERRSYVGMDPFSKGSEGFMLTFFCRPFEQRDNGAPAASYAYKDIDQDANNGAMRDPASGKWVIRPIAISSEDAKTMDLDSAQIRALPRSRYGGQLDAVNATGYYRVENDTMGEETTRGRRFEACLMRPPNVLCASGGAGLLREPKKNLVPHMIKLLKTVDFIE